MALLRVKTGLPHDPRQKQHKPDKRINVKVLITVKMFVHEPKRTINPLSQQRYATRIRDSDNLANGKLVHSHIIKNGDGADRFLGNLLIEFYGKYEALQDVCSMFDRMHVPNIFSWNITIAACVKCGNLQCAHKVFHRMPQRDVVSWNIIIAGYAQSEYGSESHCLFKQMLLEGDIPNRATYVALLDACMGSEDLDAAKYVHQSILRYGYEKDIVVASALINTYGKCGSLQAARVVFDNMVHHDVVSWTVMLSAYGTNACSSEALEHFRRMQLQGMLPNKVTYLTLLDICAEFGDLAQGKEIHHCILQAGCKLENSLGTSLITMYAKCGSIEDAKAIFNQMDKDNVVVWNAIFAAYSQNAKGHEIFQLFQHMLSQGVVPNGLTFMSILCTCSHFGLIDEGCHCFLYVRHHPGIKLSKEHCNCLIDLLVRAGIQGEVEDFIENMAFEPLVVPWKTFLSACRSR